jgi:ketosteroid isomerase-like protein
VKSILASTVFGLALLAAAPAALAQAPMSAPAASAEDAAGIKTALTLFTAGMNGDAKSLAAAHTASPTVVDEFAPFRWSGPEALKTWMGDFFKFAGPQGVVGATADIGAPEALNVVGDKAYATAAVTLTFKLKDGSQVATLGQFALVLVKDGGAWKIDHWTYVRTGVKTPG